MGAPQAGGHGPRVVIAGGSGFLGRNLSRALVARGCQVVVLSRSEVESAPGLRWLAWDNQSVGEWWRELDGARAVVNLVGRSVDCRKTPDQRREILESRLSSVRVLREAQSRCQGPPPVWVQTGSAHICGDPLPEDTLCDEESPPGRGFAPEVCVPWESAFRAALLPGQRGVQYRISFVLGNRGGALPRMTRLVRWGLGGRLGTGEQYISWIHEEDMDRLFVQAIEDERMRGVYVATSPNPVTNRDFMKALRRAWRRPWSPPVPAPAIRLGARFLLRTDPELALLGRRCVPTRLLNETAFQFRWPEIGPALDHLRQAARTMSS